MQHPKKIETVHVETLDGELCIYDWQRMEVHNLNPTAATVWNLCDGQNQPQQMAAHLNGDLTPAQAEELVWLTLKQLEQVHLLQEAVVKPAGRNIYSRRQMLKGLGLTAALLPVIHSIVAPGPIEAQSPTNTPVPTGSQTFAFANAEQQFTVPAGVTAVTIQACGAQGGEGAFPGNPVDGLGGCTQATIPVTPGETLVVFVGGQGGNGNREIGGAGGFNGGGAGGGTTFGSSLFTAGGGGGGASDVRQGGAALANRVVVGGGGGGEGDQNTTDTGAGGIGGGLTGGAGGNGSAGNGGGGGTQGSGGAGGSSTGGPNGTGGTLGSGGTGGRSAPLCGGGGGGGYFGGGGGGASDFTVIPAFGAGGGGGSSFAAPGATGVTHQQGVRDGDGQVVISW